MTQNHIKEFNLSTLMRHIQVDKSGCWLWTGPIFRDGYGQLSCRRDGRRHNARAHRASYELHFSPPGNKIVCHRCDTPRCINPDHLFLGTQADNIADMDAKGRRIRASLKGGAHPVASVSDEVAIEIRAISGVPLATIARRYSLSVSNVRSIRSNRNWKHLPSVPFQELKHNGKW